MTTITHHDVLVRNTMEDLAQRFVFCTDAEQFDLANEIYFAMYAKAARHTTGRAWLPVNHPSSDGTPSDSRQAHAICDGYISVAWDNR